MMTAAAAQLVPADHVVLTGSQVRLGDVATIVGMIGAAKAALERRIIAELPAERRSLALSRAAIASLVRRAAPGIEVTGVTSAPITLVSPIRLVRHPSAPPASSVTSQEVVNGTVLTLVSSVGPVSVERTVTTLQGARPGRRVFVRDGDGNVFASRLAADSAQ